jgi:hypothetical protein
MRYADCPSESGHSRVARRKKLGGNFTIEFGIFTTEKGDSHAKTWFIRASLKDAEQDIANKLERTFVLPILPARYLTHRFDLYQAEIKKSRLPQCSGLGTFSGKTLARLGGDTL